MINEVWKSIDGYDGYYEVSNLGNIRSVDRCVIASNGAKKYFKGQQLKTWHSHNGYVLCNLKKNGKSKTVRVNRIVAQTFIPNPYNHPVINHINFDKDDNCVDNLEWCSHKYNINYTYNNCMSKSQKHVLKLDPYTLQVLDEYISLADAARNNNCYFQNISRCCYNKDYKCGGYKWRFAND